MNEVTIATPQGQFTAQAARPADGPLVLLLHGYPQTRHSWRHQVPALGAARYRAVAPDQRGYSPGVRPDPAKGLAAYGIDRLVQDVLAMADAAGKPGRPFHLVGHDWGGHVGWVTAHRHPARIRSLAILSRPASRRLPARVQGERRRPAAPLPSPQDLPRPDHRPTAAGGRRASAPGSAGRAGRLRGRHRGVHLGARRAGHARGGARLVPGGTGPFRFEVQPGVGHFVTDEAPEAVTRLLLSHLSAQE